MNKHLIVKYFDTYAESRKTFKTKEEAVNAVMEENKKNKTFTLHILGIQRGN